MLLDFDIRVEVLLRSFSNARSSKLLHTFTVLFMQIVIKKGVEGLLPLARERPVWGISKRTLRQPVRVKSHISGASHRLEENENEAD